MSIYDEILAQKTFSLSQAAKEALFTRWLRLLTQHHSRNCSEYRQIIAALSFDMEYLTLESMPFLPVRLFKDMELKSIEQKDIFKVMTSSGTSSQVVSKIFLDRETASNQQKSLVKIVSDFLGIGRLPMLIIDSPEVVKNRQLLSARGAGILGFSIFGADRTYALDKTMQLDIKAVKVFLDKHKAEKILLFGFTFMIWQHFYKALMVYNEQYGKLNLCNGILVHGGGWKKLIHEAVSPTMFKQALNKVCGLKSIHDYYGMAEQTGSIYLECEYGHLHASIFSDVIMRRAIDFSPCTVGEAGIIQAISLLPTSYPGHSLLTEDWGTVLGVDDCPCGRKGKYFKVHGRLAAAEIRGCSDTYATDS